MAVILFIVVIIVFTEHSIELKARTQFSVSSFFSLRKHSQNDHHFFAGKVL